MKISFTSQEISMLISALNEYCEIMGEAEDTQDYTEYMLENGLGSAMKKIYKGKVGEAAYNRYANHREGYTYPSFGEWGKLQEEKNKKEKIKNGI